MPLPSAWGPRARENLPCRGHGGKGVQGAAGKPHYSHAPAVEAGEKLGFLPGDLQNKVDPYLRPLYDALFDMLGAETYQKLLEKQLIEVAPLAYMRGRTLDDAFIILRRGAEHKPGTDENVSHTHGHWFKSGGDRAMSPR